MAMIQVMFFSLFVKVLCELFQSAPQRGNVPVSGNISGFIRRLFLQLMLEDEKVTVFLQSPCPVGGHTHTYTHNLTAYALKTYLKLKHCCSKLIFYFI